MILTWKGAFGEVRSGIHKASGEVRAIKLIKKDALDEEQKTMLLYEIDLLKNLTHPSIVKLYETFEDQKFYYMVTELLNGGELFDEIISRRKFSEADAANVMKQVIGAINYCHDRNVAHRDLKPENVMLSEPGKLDVRLIDFGTA